MRFKIQNRAWYFFLVVALIYVLLFFIKRQMFNISFDYFTSILVKVLPVFVLVFVLMSLMNYFVKPKTLVKHLGDKKIRAWVFAVIGGVLSMGPIYMWYPLLADFKSKGVSNGLIACFLYNRAIKIPLIPIAVFYFNLKYVLILLIVMIFMSLIQGLIINKLMDDNTND